LDRSFFSICVLATIVRGAIATENYFGGTNDTSYLDWVKQKGAFYDSSVFLPASSTDDSQGTALHWKLDDENIYVAVAARATGWLALGLAETGGMRGSDVVIYETATPGQLRDAYILEERVPLTDDCQDWTFVDSFNEGGFLIFEGVRRLVTNDAQDYAVFNDTESVIAAQFIIAAWGDSETVQYHGINRARGSVRWYGGGDEVTLFREKMKTLSDGYFDLLTNNHTIEAVETKYVTFPFPWDTDIVPQGLPANEIVSVIGLEYLVDDNAGVYVHHANLYANICGQQSYGAAIFSWATGGLPFAMPDNAAFLFGSTNSDCIPSFNLTVHYNNPSLVQGIVDNGGLRMYYSLTPREHEMGIMALADGRVYLEGIPVGDGLTQYSYACDASCSDLALDAPVTVIHELFHMHIKGTAAASYHLRDGAAISQSNVNFFDFDQSGTYRVKSCRYRYLNF
jgi:DOMON domain